MDIGRSLSRIAVIGVLLTLCVSLQDVAAQFQTRWLAVGSFGHRYSASGAEPATDFHGLTWPNTQPGQNQNVMRAMWIGAKNFTDERGETFPHKVVHAGPRTPGEGQVFPITFKTVNRFPSPDVRVDGFRSFNQFTVVNEVDPSIKADQILVNEVRTQMGVNMKRRILQWSQPHHDNYHITEFVFTNTGNIDSDEEVELPDQTLEGVYFFFLDGYYTNGQSSSSLIPEGAWGQAWGKYQMFDFVGDTMQDYEVDFRASYSWQGYTPPVTRYDPIGAPLISDEGSGIYGHYIPSGDSTGRLSAPQFIGRATLHADTSPEDRTDDRNQPSTTSLISQDQPITQSNSAFNRDQMATEYNFMSQGHVVPHHADQIEPPNGSESWRERMAEGTNDPSDGIAGGYNNAMAYGPYTLEPGDSIRIVTAEGSSGLSHRAATVIGEEYKDQWQQATGGQRVAVSKDIEYDADGDGTIDSDESMPKNHWVMTGRDSLFKTFERAIANFESGYGIPKGPKPPKSFRVVSKPDAIELSWETFEDASPQGFEIYRTNRRWFNDPYKLVAEVGAGERSYRDTEVTRGLEYYYYIQVVGQVNSDGTGRTPTGVPLRSNRLYTQTYDPASLKRPPGESLEEATVVPNPYNLQSDQNIRWPAQRDKLGFLDIPGQATIRIYTESGELVETIRHTDGSGDEFWDLTTGSNQIIRSGIYQAVITNENTGEQIIRPFTVIR